MSAHWFDECDGQTDDDDDGDGDESLVSQCVRMYVWADQTLEILFEFVAVHGPFFPRDARVRAR